MKKLISSLMLIFLCHQITLGQYTKYDDKPPKENKSNLSEKPFNERIFWGTGGAFSVFNRFLYLDISPFVGYKLTERLGAGFGARYSLLRDLDFQENYSNYGGSIFARYKLIPQAFLHAELEALQAYDFNRFSPNYGGRAMAYMGFVGAGYMSGAGGLSFNILLLYDLIDHSNSPYQNAYIFGSAGMPIVSRIGVTFNF